MPLLIRFGSLLRVSAIVIAVALAAGLLMNHWVRRRAVPHLYERLGEVPARPVAIVPGASVHADGTPSPALRERLTTALELHRQGRVARILVSGDGADPHYDEVAGMARWLAEHGVDEGAVLRDPDGRRTLSTMERAASVHGLRGAVVCTQGYHLPRAVFLARRAGIDAVGLAADRGRRHDPPGTRLREFVARIRAVVDAYLIRTDRHASADMPPDPPGATDAAPGGVAPPRSG